MTMTTVAHDIEAHLEKVTPKTHPGRDAQYFRHIVSARLAAQEAERKLYEAVVAAREHGESWTAIAAALGTSRQAAQQRFGKDE